MVTSDDNLGILLDHMKAMEKRIVSEITVDIDKKIGQAKQGLSKQMEEMEKRLMADDDRMAETDNNRMTAIEERLDTVEEEIPVIKRAVGIR